MNTLLKNKLEILKALCRQYKVKTMYSFGSVNSDHFNSESDIDLLIEFEPEISVEEYTDNYFDLREDLVNLFKRRIDLITNRSLSNPFFLKDLEQTKQLLYGA